VKPKESRAPRSPRRSKWQPGEQARAFAEIKAVVQKLWFGEVLVLSDGSYEERLMDILGPLYYSETLSHQMAAKTHIALLGYLPGEIAIGNVNPIFFELLNLLYDYCDGTTSFDTQAVEWVGLDTHIDRLRHRAEVARAAQRAEGPQ
jgi:hypothetical protein